jgi:2,3-bisphosphoglycerate-independent phosphoglycerate mutase
MGEVPMEKLSPIQGYAKPKGPVVLVIMDGVGIGKYEEGDMVRRATKPNLDWLAAHVPYTQVKAHGKAVGMPSDEDMGNSEVGHNAIGSGRVFSQGARLVQEAIDSGRLWQGEVWNQLITQCASNHTALHFIGLLSDGNVHTHINHLLAMLRQAKVQDVTKARVHCLLDGRDVPPTSALEYVDQLEAELAELNADETVDFAIASGGGRLNITMDRYEADWDMVKRGWEIHVRGIGPEFNSAREAIESHRAAKPGVIDQDLDPFVIVKDGKPLGPIQDGDAVIIFNFRGDRAIEMSRALEEDEFDKFDRSPRPKIAFAGMMQYDGDKQIPKRFLVDPPAISRTVGEFLAVSGVRQLAVSETQKYGHVTYFFNGNRSGKFSEELETYVEIPSDRLPFEQRPWMKAAEITDVVIKAMQERSCEFVRVNYPNGDMVGHTGNYLAVEISVEAVDLGVGRLMAAARATGSILVLTADHGNADDMYERNKKTGEVAFDSDTGQPKPKTAHSLNPVPVYFYDPANRAGIELAEVEAPGISNLAATCLVLLGYQPPPEYEPSLVRVKSATS